MKLAVLAFIARLFGIQFTVYGLPFGASYERSLRTLRGNKLIGSSHPEEWNKSPGSIQPKSAVMGNPIA